MTYVNFLILWNLITFAMMGIDKRQSIKRKERISEKTLLLASFLFGGIGILLGMFIFRHKTKHWNFRILVPIGIALDILFLFNI